MTITHDALKKLQKDAGLSNLPTPFTYELRMAVSGIGEKAFEWQDKPHRLIFDACRQLEAEAVIIDQAADRLTAMKAAGDGLAGLAVHTKQCPIIKGWGQAGNCTCGLTDALKQWKEASDGL